MTVGWVILLGLAAWGSLSAGVAWVIGRAVRIADERSAGTTSAPKERKLYVVKSPTGNDT